MEFRNYVLTEETITLTPHELRRLEKDRKDLYFDHISMHLDGTDTYQIYKRIVKPEVLK